MTRFTRAPPGAVAAQTRPRPRGGPLTASNGCCGLGSQLVGARGLQQADPLPLRAAQRPRQASASDTTRGGAGPSGEPGAKGHGCPVGTARRLPEVTRERAHEEQSRRMLIPSGCRRNLDSYDGQEASKPSGVDPLDPSGPGRGWPGGRRAAMARPC